MNVLRIADVPNNRTGGMSRILHETSDVMRARGVAVELAFSEDLDVGVRGPMRRFAVPMRVVDYVRRHARGGRFDAVEVHEPIAGAYALARRVDRALPPLLVMS